MTDEKEEDHGIAEFNLFESRVRTLNMQVRDLKRRVQEAEARASTLSNELAIASAEVLMYKNRSLLDIEERDFYARYSTALLAKLAGLGEASAAMAKRTLVEANSLTENITELMTQARKEARIGSVTSGASQLGIQSNGDNPSATEGRAIPFAKSTPIKGGAPPNGNTTK